MEKADNKSEKLKALMSNLLDTRTYTERVKCTSDKSKSPFCAELLLYKEDKSVRRQSGK